MRLKNWKMVSCFSVITILILVSFIGNVVAAEKPFTIGLVTWPGYGPLFIAKEKNLVTGLNIDLKVIDDTAARRAAFKSGAIDMIAETVDSFASGKPGYQMGSKTVYKTDESRGGDGLIADDSIKNINDLKGKKVAFPEGLPGHFLLLKLLNMHGMSQNDIKATYMEADAAGQAFVAKKVDAAVTWEPFVTESTDKSKGGHGKILLTSADAEGFIVDVMVCSEETIKKRAADIQKVVDAHFAGLAYLKSHPQEGYQIMAKYLPPLTPADVEGIVSGLNYCGKTNNINYFSGSPSPMENLFNDASNTWVKAKIIQSVTKGAESYTNKFVVASKVENVEVSPAETPIPEPTPVVKTKILAGNANTPVSLSRPILFASGKAEINFQKSRVDLDEIGSFLEHFPTYYVIVEGHTDAVGDADLNKKLSEQRAKAVADFLKSYKIGSNQLVPVGYGEERLKVNTQAASDENRRVEFKLVKP